MTSLPPVLSPSSILPTPPISLKEKFVPRFFFLFFILYYFGNRGSTVVKALYYKSERHWFEPNWCQWNFSLT